MQVNVGRIGFGLQQADLTTHDAQSEWSGTNYAGAMTAERLIEVSTSFVLALHVNLIAIQHAATTFSWGQSVSVGIGAVTALILVMAVVEKLSFEAKARPEYPEGSLINRVVANAAFLTVLPAFLPGLATAYLWCNRR